MNNVPAMLPLQRKHAILQYLARHGRATVAELSSLCNVSGMTIRRDLESLETEGLLHRTHGGALPVETNATEPSYDAKKGHQEDLKDRIAAYAAGRFVQDGTVLILEGGTTVTGMVPYLDGHSDLTAVTNGLRTVTALQSVLPASTVLCSGGMLRSPSATFVGPVAEQFFRQFHAEIAFFSASGLTAADGFTDPNLLEIQVKREMRAAAKFVVALVDSTKLGNRSFAQTFRLDEVNALITDAGAPPELVAHLRAQGLDVYIA